MQKTSCILIIDHEPIFLEVTKKALGREFLVDCVSTREEGLKKAKGESPDLIVLGYLEPRGTSGQLASTLAENKATLHIPVLVIDVAPEEYPRKGWRWSDGFSHNVKGYLWRPIDATELKQTIKGVLQRTKAGAMNLTEVAEQTGEMLKRIDQLKKLLMSGTDNDNV